MATSTIVCELCNLQNFHKPSSYWSLVCDEALCSECKVLHNLQKATRDHNTIHAEEYQKLPPDILQISQYCPEHDDRFSLFCKTHDCPICVKCVESHKECKDLVPLENVISNVKTSKAFQDIIQTLDDLEHNVQTINIEKQEVQGNIAKQKRKFKDQIQAVREKINKHLDTLQDQIMKDIDVAEDKACKSMQKITSTIEENKNEIKSSKITIKHIEQYASDLQAFLGMKDIQWKVGQCEKVVNLMAENFTKDNVEMVCNIDNKIDKLISHVTSFGSVELEKRETKMNIVRQKDKEAQIVYSSPGKSIQNIKVQLAKKINVNKREKRLAIRGCGIKTSDGFLFSNYQYNERELISVTADNSKDFTLNPIPIKAFDFTLINSDKAVVTSGYDGGRLITLVDLTTKRNIRSIQLSGRTYGITCTATTVLVCIEDEGIQLLDSTSLELSTMLKCNVGMCSYVTVYKGNIYVTRYNEHTVTCYDMKGQEKWKFSNKSILNEPEGITTDKSGNIYVVGEKSNNVVVISSDGKQWRQLLSKDDGLDQPTALCFDDSGRKLMVANLYSDAFVYDVL